jgi:hypothetical protein
MDRRTLIVSGLASLGGASLAGTAFAQAQPMTDLPDPGQHSDYPTPQTFNSEELAHTVSDYLGVTAESAGAAIQRLFRDNGLPTAYIAGEEGSGAMGLGLRYGKGLLYMKGHPPQDIAWQGPSVGWDVGGNVSRVFTLVYNLQYPDMVYRRFPGVEGSGYLIGGLGVNYQRGDGITLAPVRAGVGLRLGANIGYLSYSRKSTLWPF